MTFDPCSPLPVCPAPIVGQSLDRSAPMALAAVVLALAWLASSTTAAEAQVKIFRTDTRDAALEGTAEGIAIGPLGQIELSPEVERLAGLDEPFVFSAAATTSGWLIGTGNEGKVFHVSTDGVPELVAELAHPTVFAVLGRDDGTWLAAGSPGAKVYRIAPGAGSEDGPAEILDAEATYVWDLAEDAQGRLLVATGLPGKVLRVAGSKVETLWQSPDDHVRTLLARPDGSVWAGTAGQGRIVRLAPGGSVRTLHDAAHPEVLAFADTAAELGARGESYVYAALLASEASLVDLSSSAEASDEDSVTPSGEVTVGSRGAGFQGPRSVVLRLRAEGEFLGQAERVADLDDETIHSLAVTSGELWIGTGQEGALYRLRGDVLVRELRLEDRQIVVLEAVGETLGAITTNGAAVFRVSARAADRGTYTSKVLDAEQPARFGVFRWHGEADGGAEDDPGEVDIELRAGSSSEPDATWSDWISVGRGAAPGADLQLASVGNGRFVQWRAVLRRGSVDGSGPRIEATELSYRQLNQAPDIASFAAKAPGQILVSQSFNPTATVYEPWSPDRQGIFVSLDEEKGGEGKTKTLWKRGWRTLEWKAADANGDSLLYRVEVRAEGGESRWLPVVDELEQAYYSFDVTVLPDGIYRFRLTASDGPAWPRDERLEAREISEPVTVDHTPPRLAAKTRSAGLMTVRVEDELSPVRRVEVSVDAGEWRELRPLDGLADGHAETLRVPVPEGIDLLLLRVMDASFNVVTWSLLDD